MKARILIVSVLAHVAVIAWLKVPQWLPAAQKAPGAAERPVTVRIVEAVKPAAHAPRAASKRPAAARSGGDAQVRKSKRAGRPAAIGPEDPVRYGDLFPDAVTMIERDGARAAAGGSDGVDVRSSQGRQIAGEQLSGKVDIPLFFRQKNPEAKAVAMLRSRPQHDDWFFASIDGDPHLRAVLYESLSAEKNDRAVRELFVAAGPQITIVLLQRALSSLDGARGPTESTTWSNGRLVIQRTVHGRGGGGGGGMGLSMALPDEEAERARRRDRTAVTALERSPAFHAPIRNRFPRRVTGYQNIFEEQG